MLDYRGWFVSPTTPSRGQLFINSVTLYAYDTADAMDDDNYATMLESFVSTSSIQVAQVNTENISILDRLVFAKKLGISPDKALYMISHTTQHGVHTVLHLSLSRQFSWSHLFPMKRKSEVHEVLFLLFQQDGVPLAVICDSAKEMILGEFNQKFKEALCHLKRMEHFTPWSNAAKRDIKKLKKGSNRKLIKSGTPKRLWNDCFELKFYIRSNTTHGIYKLDG